MFPKNALSGASLALALALSSVIASATAAGEKNTLEPGIALEQGYDSNIFDDPNTAESGWTTRVTPSLRLGREGEKGYAYADLSATGNYNSGDASELDGWDTKALLDVSRTLTDRFLLFGNGRYENLHDYSPIYGEGDTDLLEGSRPTVQLTDGSGGLRYLLEDRTDLTLYGGGFTANYDGTEAESRTYRDRDIVFTRLALGHQLTPMDRLTLSGGVNWSRFADLTPASVLTQITLADVTEECGISSCGEQKNTIETVSLDWTRQWNPRWTTRASIGASFVQSKLLDEFNDATEPFQIIPGIVVGNPAAAASPFVDFDNDDSSVVGSIKLIRRFVRSSIEIGYSRDTQPSGAIGSTVLDVDTFSGTFKHRLAERVTFQLTASYQLYRSATDGQLLYGAPVYSVDRLGNPKPSCIYGGSGRSVKLASGGTGYQCTGGSGEAANDVLLGAARIDWQIYKRVNAYAVFRYFDRKDVGSDPVLYGEPYDKYNLAVGVRYVYDAGF